MVCHVVYSESVLCDVVGMLERVIVLILLVWFVGLWMLVIW